jgi:aconitate hydratase A / 2-methylisocitrate dehydratase
MNHDAAPHATAIYARLAAAAPILRRRLGRALTLTDKILLGHLDDPAGQPLGAGRETLRLRADRVVLQDVLGQTAFMQLAQTDRTRVAVPTSVHCDHLVEARDGALRDLARSHADSDEVYDFLRSAAARWGAGFWEPGAGIIHQVVLEQYAFPGQLILGTDSHTPNAGGLGACAVGVGGADAVEVMAGLPWEVLEPRRIGVRLTGALRGWATAKDIILWLAGRLTVSGGTNAIVEYLGPGARTLGATGKATICNMGAELGATSSLFPADAAMRRYLAASGRAALVPLVDGAQALLEADPEVERDPDRYYDQVIELDLDALEPHVVGPHSPDRARPLSQLAAEVGAPGSGHVDAIAVALIGSCTNSSSQDLTRTADVARQAAAHGLVARSELLVTPGSQRVLATIARDGQLAALESVGARVLASACGPCIGQWQRSGSPDATAAAPSTIVSSYNRNFPGRNDGRPATQHFIASPEIALALALAGRLSFDPRRDPLIGADGQPFLLAPPSDAPDVPAAGLAAAAAGAPGHIAPPADGRGIPLAFRPGSERLAPLPRWPAWDGRDLLDLPVLARTRGKTTTDHIAPAGPWLRYRGNLERFADNLLSTASLADGAAPGTAVDVETGARGTIAAIARGYRSRGLRWVIVGDANYGEGSSREHAALSPRLLGCAAVIARSFARIHESNLKKQGLLALTFADPADQDRIGAADRLSLLDLASLAPGRPVRCLVRHPDATTTELPLAHSYTASQLAWFRAGSALATLR